MLKGMNKQVIEVMDTGSKYFERALLIVNPKNSTNQSQIYHEAARLFAGRGPEEKEVKSGTPVWLLLVCVGLGALIGALVIWAITL